MNFLRMQSARKYATRAKPDKLLPSAIDLWEQQNAKPVEEPIPTDDFYNHDLYTPLAKPDLGFKQLKKPLHFPKFDQTKKAIHVTGVDSFKTVKNVPFDSDSPIGSYPRLEQQWTSLKDPLSYWDQQGRRNYGEVLHEFDNFQDIWGIGHEGSMKRALESLRRVFGVVAIVAGVVYFWDPKSHAIWAEKDYPFDGLRVEMGGDPADPSDNFNSAQIYKI